MLLYGSPRGVNVSGGESGGVSLTPQSSIWHMSESSVFKRAIDSLI